jgi:hypothetical protein
MCIASVYSRDNKLLVIYTQGLDTHSAFGQSPDALVTVKFCLVGGKPLPVAWSRRNLHACYLPSAPPRGTRVTLITAQQVQLPSEAQVVLSLHATRKHQVCAMTQIKSEAKYVRDCVDYHHRLGVSLMLINDNNSTDDLDHVLLNFSKDVVLKVDWPWQKSQAQAYSFARVLLERSCEWVFFMDLDQYVYTTEPLGAMFAGFNDSIAQVCLYSKQFHHSGLVKCPTAAPPLVYTYLEGISPSPNCATRISQASLVSHIHMFGLRARAGKTVLLTVDQGKWFSHYSTRCWEDYRAKFFKGRNGLVNDWPVTAEASSDAPPDTWVRRLDLVKDAAQKDLYTKLMSGMSKHSYMNPLPGQA